MRIFLLCSAILILSFATLTTTATKPVVASFEPLPLPDEPGVVVLPLDAKVVRDSRGRVTCPMKGSSQRKECGYPEGVCCAELGMCCPQGFRCRQRGAYTTCARAVPVAHSPGVGQTVVDPDLTQVIVRPIIHINTMSAPKVDDVIDAAEMTREANEKPMDDVIAAAKEKRQNVLWHNRNEVFRGYPDQLAAQAAAKAALSNKANAIPPPSKKKFRNAPRLVDTDPKDAVPAHDADIDAVE